MTCLDRAWFEMFFLRSTAKQESSASKHYSSTVSQGLLGAPVGSNTFRIQVARSDFVRRWYDVCPHPKIKIKFPIYTRSTQNLDLGVGLVFLAKIEIWNNPRSRFFVVDNGVRSLNFY